jgi:hypothetical protein
VLLVESLATLDELLELAEQVSEESAVVVDRRLVSSMFARAVELGSDTDTLFRLYSMLLGGENDKSGFLSAARLLETGDQSIDDEDIDNARRALSLELAQVLLVHHVKSMVLNASKPKYSTIARGAYWSRLDSSACCAVPGFCEHSRVSGR